MEKELVKASKYLSFILRHQPETIGLTLDENGWALIDELINKTADIQLTRDLIELVVETSDKQRFAINENGTHIRANQGHSIAVDLQLNAIEPPEYLLHGTAKQNVQSILEKGLTKGERHHVHLTQSLPVAKAVGMRYGEIVMLKIDSKSMFEEGFSFYKSVNNVWLTDIIPPEYLEII